MSPLRNIKKSLITQNLDGYAVPKNDEFFQEYSNPNILEHITNFKGSAGLALITKKENILFVDGRYTTQAKKEAGRNFKIIETNKESVKKIITSYNFVMRIGYSPKLFTSLSLEKIFGKNCQMVPQSQEIKKFIKNKYNKKTNLFYTLGKNIVGETVKSKINRLNRVLKKKRIDNIYISSPENVAWLLNIRGRDNPNSPIPNCQIILNKNKIYFFSDKQKTIILKKKKIFNNIEYFDKKKFFDVIKKINGSNILVDKDSCSIYDESLIRTRFNLYFDNDPCYRLKSIKNKIEIKNTKKIHLYDGLAMTKFLYYLKNKKLRFDEIKLEKKLEELRKRNKAYLFPSFNTISGSGPNSAIIHYKASKISNRKIKRNDIYLCDSGGQYNYGTTDVTRTICFSKQSLKIKNIFTRVLKGHIAVVSSTITSDTTGSKLDKKARKWLKEINLNYSHGTGHGVGFFLNVHEGPMSISKFDKNSLKEGMILSNEPGYYKPGHFGIRIENLIFVYKKYKKLFFDNLTFAPIDFDLINKNLLNKSEKNYLCNYHKKIYNFYKNALDPNEKVWLKNLTNKFIEITLR
mgnify:FL=1